MTTGAAVPLGATQAPWVRPGAPARVLPWAAVALAFVWALVQADVFGRDLVNWGGFRVAWEFVLAAFHPDLRGETLRVALDATWKTIAYAVAGTVLCVGLGAVLGTLSSEVFWSLFSPGDAARGRAGRTLPWMSLRLVLAFPRGIHEVIWGLFLINVFGLDPIVAVLAIGVHFGVVTAKVFAEILDETAHQPMRAMRASGASAWASLLYGLFPVAFPDLLSYSLYRLECAIRAAAVLGLIGAGGLGYQVLLSLQSLRYDQVWTFLYALILLSGLTDAWSTLLHRRMHLSMRTEVHPSLRTERPALPLDEPHGRGQTDGMVRLTLAITLVAIPWSVWYLGPQLGLLADPTTWERLGTVLRESLPPRVDAALLAELWDLSFKTLAMSILATGFAASLGMLFAFPAASTFLPLGRLSQLARSKNAWLRGSLFGASRTGLVVLRALSEPIWALIVLFFLFPGVLPGALGLGLYNLGVLGRLMAEATQHLDQRPVQALRAQGAGAVKVFLYGVLPTALPRFISFALYRWEVCIRATVIVGVVGAGGIGRLLGQQIARFDYPAVSTSLLFLVGLCFLVDLLSRALRNAVR